MGSSKQTKIPAGETVMRLLQRTFEVETRYGGGFVQEIDGVGGGRRGGRPVDWFFYVNGIEAETRRRRAAARGRRPRVVGPPRLGRRDAHPGGRRLLSRAVRVGLEGQAGAGADRLRRRARSARAREVRKRLEDAGAKVGGLSTDRLAGGPGVLRVLVGRWAEVRRDPAARRLEGGPKVSGVFALPSAKGDRLELLDPRGAAVRTLGAGSGLVAATSFLDQQPTWVVAGTDDVGRRRRGGRAERDAAARPLRGRGRERPRDPAAAAGAAERTASP